CIAHSGWSRSCALRRLRQRCRLYQWFQGARRVCTKAGSTRGAGAKSDKFLAILLQGSSRAPDARGLRWAIASGASTVLAAIRAFAEQSPVTAGEETNPREPEKNALRGAESRFFGTSYVATSG